jgi:uncharacterized membrane protein YraQ (UPF0718 family)
MLQLIVDWLLYSLFNLNPDISWVQSLNFFIYDSIKLLLLLLVMISAVGFLRTYIPEHRIKKWIEGKKYGFGNILASLFGAVTPFCSCSSIPIFLSFIKAGIPLGVSFSFLITSPIINEYLAVLMWTFFGWKIAVAYVISGILIGVFSGLILGKLKLEKYLVRDLKNIKIKKEVKYKNISQRINFGIKEAVSIIKKLWYWILIGVGIGAVIHNYVPTELIQSLISKGGIFAVPIAVLLGVPVYASCAAIVPIAVVLFNKGVPIGTALAFMMATAALSLPEAVILRRAMKLKLIALFFGIVTLAIVVTGYLFNLLQNMLI